ncbi:MAG: TIGR03617 family F420-dependent LLM class oxidoreductase [Chloroflexota bacterium]
MRVEAIVRDPPLGQLTPLARRIERLGFAGIAIPEIRRDPFILATLLANATTSLRLSTAVALAFPRSPTSTAYSARTVHDLSLGRFGLGLGTQVRGHIERRFGMTWSAPVERLRECIQAIRAVWHSWDTGSPPDFAGQQYRVTLMPPDFSPGANPHAPIPIHIGAVNTGMLELAGALCDGVRLHPFCTPRYLTEVVLPSISLGAERAGRTSRDVEIVAGGFIATGPDEPSVLAAREEVRRQIGFYASTRSYAPVLALHGWEDLGGQLRRLIAQQRWADLASLITDDILDSFCIAGTYGAVAPVIAETLSGLVNTLTLSIPEDDAHDDELGRLVRQLQTVPGAG